jgi:ABC-type transporter Mla subunit MlaD
MAKKKVNRKKQLRKQVLDLRKAGLSLTSAVVDKAQEVIGNVVDATEKVVDNVVESTENVVETMTEKVQNVTEQLSHKSKKVEEKVEEAAPVIEKKVAEKKKALDEAQPVLEEQAKEVKETVEENVDHFDALVAELEGLAMPRLETFYAEGIRAKNDFKKWTEEELLALKGIGPATIKQLKELGITFKD